MRHGTSHFDCLDSAIRYYSVYGFNGQDVRDKLDSGEISIGKPDVKQGQKLMISTSGRYHIEEQS